MKKFYALKTLCALFLFALVGVTASAQEVKFDFGANEFGLELGSGSGATAEVGNITAPFEKDGVTLTFDKATGGTPPRMWKGPQLRTYKGNTMTVTAPEGQTISSIQFTADGSSNFYFAVDGTDIDLNTGWTGEAASVTFDGTGTSRLLTVTVTLGSGGETPDPTPQPERYDIFTESFANGQGDFTVDDVSLAEGLSYVWSADTEYGYMKASAYVSGTNYAAESWLISPVIDLTGSTNSQLAFDHAGNFFGGADGMAAAVSVKARVEGTEDWTDLTLSEWASGSSWTFSATTADLSAFDGQRIQLAFVYTSTADVAGTWEVKNVVVSGELEEAPEPDPDVPGLLFSETFADGQGEFTINDVNVGDFYVWAPDSRYACMKATAFVSGTNYASESWLVSPVIDLTGVQGAQLAFEHAGNFFGDSEGMAAAVSVKACVEGTDEWTDLTLSQWASGSNWTFVPTTADLSAFAGQRIQLAFVYTSTDEAAGTWEVKNIEVTETEGEAPVDVAEPTFSPEAGAYNNSVEVSLSAAEGLTVYYTTDGTEPTTASTLYEAPFTLTETTTVKAIAVDAEGNVSDVVSATYTVRQPLDVPEGCVGFDFTMNPWGLPISTQEENFEITRVEQDGVVLTSTSGTTPTRMWNDFNLGPQLRVYNGATLTFTAPEGYQITKIEFVASRFDLTTTDGTLIDQTWEGSAPSVTFDVNATTNISTVLLTFDRPVVDGIDSVTTGTDAAPVIYTIDGRRVERAERGLYIINGQKVYVK